MSDGGASGFEDVGMVEDLGLEFGGGFFVGEVKFHGRREFF